MENRKRRTTTYFEKKMKNKKLKPSKNQKIKKPRWSIPSARKERQKYTSDEYRLSFDQILWDSESKKRKKENDGT